MLKYMHGFKNKVTEEKAMKKKKTSDLKELAGSKFVESSI